jgi:hypothetical protein
MGKSVSDGRRGKNEPDRTAIGRSKILGRILESDPRVSRAVSLPLKEQAKLKVGMRKAVRQDPGDAERAMEVGMEI